MRTRIALISVAIVSLFAATASVAQNPHAGHGAHSGGAGQPQTMGDMDRMMGMMRQMMSIMERMMTSPTTSRQ